jgi:hypothetical protein
LLVCFPEQQKKYIMFVTVPLYYITSNADF